MRGQKYYIEETGNPADGGGIMWHAPSGDEYLGNAVAVELLNSLNDQLAEERRKWALARLDYLTECGPGVDLSCLEVCVRDAAKKSLLHSCAVGALLELRDLKGGES